MATLTPAIQDLRKLYRRLLQDETAEGLLGIHSMEKAVKNRHEDGEEGEDDEEPKTINSHTAQKVDEDRSDAPEVLIKDLDDRYSSEVEDEQLGAERASNKPPTLRHTPDDFQRQRSILQRSRLYKPFVASFQENLTQDQTDTKFLGLSRLKRERVHGLSAMGPNRYPGSY